MSGYIVEYPRAGARRRRSAGCGRHGRAGAPGFTQHPALSTILYTCGPELMMKPVADIASQRNIECQIAVERAMACGMGTCQSC